MLRCVLPLVLCLSLVKANAVEPELKSPDLYSPALPGTVHLRGDLGEQLDACIEHRLLAQDIEAVVKPYREKKEIGSGDWRCEYWGKWYTSLVLADAYKPTRETQQKREEAYAALLSSAAPDGYLGTRSVEHRLKGWDVWGRKYALLGVLAYYDRTRKPGALVAAKRHADILLAEVGPGKANITDIGEHKGLAASSVLEPIVLLYERTGDERYLNFANYIVGQWSNPTTSLTNGMRLIQDALARTPPAGMTWNKAYEMMSCFEGLCELHRVTGNKDYLQAAAALADGIMNYEVTLVGPGTQIEHWFGGRTNQTGVVNRPMETCVTATWMKYLYQLLRLTGDPRYADELEKNLYNGLTGAIMPDGSWWAYFSGLMGERVPSDMQHEDVGLSCCVVNGPRALMLTPSWAVMSSKDGPVINLFNSLTAEYSTPAGKPAKLQIEGDYPLSGKIRLRLNHEADETYTVSIRIPEWSARAELRVNGSKVPVHPGTYARLSRHWERRNEIDLTFDMRGRLISAPENNGQLAVVRGPIVLAIDTRLVPPGQNGSMVLNTNEYPFISLKERKTTVPGVRMEFDVPCLVDGKKRNLSFCDFASAGSAWSETNRYRTWLPQPLNLEKAFDTGQSWQLLTHRPYRPGPNGRPPPTETKPR